MKIDGAVTLWRYGNRMLPTVDLTKSVAILISVLKLMAINAHVNRLILR